MSESPSVKSDYRPFLDQVRWIAALIVAIGHALAILNNQANGSQIINYIADMRGPAVCVFFVLSGYLVGGLVLRDLERFRLSSYSVARFSKIYILLIPAILLTLLLDGIAFHFYPASPVYSKVWQGGALGDDLIFSRYSVANFVGSVLSLEPLFGRPIGSAGSLWSLGYEWIFYFLFPLLWTAGYRLGGSACGNIMVFLSVAGVFFVTKIGAAYRLIWLMGAYAYRLRLSALLKNERVEAIVKGVAFCGVLVPLIHGGQISHQITILGIGFFGFLFLSSNALWEHRLTMRYDHALAGFSYSLYVTHLQCLSFAAAILCAIGLLPSSGMKSPLGVVIGATVLLSIAVAIAYAFGRVFESRTQTLSRWLKARLLLPRSPSPTST